jgi:SAM-dependent methyltransferase
MALKLLNHKAFSAIVDEFYKRLERKPLFLDFGCGAGHFLDRARKLGCKTIGMDFSPRALEQVARRGHQALSISDSDWDKIEEGSVGFVRLNHVVEHLYNPREIMRRIHGKMSPGAGLHLATPNADSANAERFREFWWGLDCPRHIVIFTPQVLSRLIRDSGLTDIVVLQEPLAKDALRSWMYARIDFGLEPPQDVAALASDGLLNLRFAPASRAAAKAGMADRFHILAAKAA